MRSSEKNFCKDFPRLLTEVVIVRVGDHLQRFVSLFGKADLDGSEIEAHATIACLLARRAWLRSVKCSLQLCEYLFQYMRASFRIRLLGSCRAWCRVLANRPRSFKAGMGRRVLCTIETHVGARMPRVLCMDKLTLGGSGQKKTPPTREFQPGEQDCRRSSATDTGTVR